MQGLNWQTQNVESGRHWKVREGGQARGDYSDLGADQMGNMERAIKD